MAIIGCVSVFVISDQHDRQLRVIKPFNDSGVGAIASPVGLGTPAGLAVDGDGNVIVADSSGDRLVVWDVWRGAWTVYGASGAAQGQFSRPAAVATDFDDRVYIADSGNSRVIRIDDSGGGGWTAFGAPGGPTPEDPIAEGLFKTPMGVAVDDFERIIVTDPAAGRAVRFDGMNGDGWTVLPLPAGAEPSRPFGIAVGDDWIAVSDVGNHAVHLIGADGDLLASLDGMAAGLPVPAYLASDGEFLTVADIVANELRRYRVQAGALVLADILRGSSPARIEPLFQQIGGIASGGR